MFWINNVYTITYIICTLLVSVGVTCRPPVHMFTLLTISLILNRNDSINMTQLVDWCSLDKRPSVSFSFLNQLTHMSSVWRTKYGPFLLISYSYSRIWRCAKGSKTCRKSDTIPAKYIWSDDTILLNVMTINIRKTKTDTSTLSRTHFNAKTREVHWQVKVSPCCHFVPCYIFVKFI